MYNIVDVLRTMDCEDLLPEETAEAADEIERLRAENEALTNAVGVYRALMWSVTEDAKEAAC